MLDSHFFSNPEGINAEDYVIATYLCSRNSISVVKDAWSLANGQSTGTWVQVADDSDQVRETAAAKVLAVYEVPHYEDSLPPETGERSSIVIVAYPLINIGNQIPQMLTTVLGNVSLTGKVKLLDIRFPKKFVKTFPGPLFGIDGLRQQVKAGPRPLLCSVFKPCVGAPPSVLARMTFELGIGGTDIVKDDELLADPEYCSLDKRLEACLESLQQVEKERDRKMLYALNVTDAPKKMSMNIERALQNGANCLMFNVPTLGWAAFADAVVQVNGRVPILAHPDFAGAFYGSPQHGMNSALVLGKLMRICGADLVPLPSSYGKLPLLQDRVLSIASALRSPLYDLKDTLPGPSGGLHPGQVHLLLEDFGIDTLITAGGGYHGHPQGSRAGARAFMQAIEAWQKNVDVETYSRNYPELKEALRIWGIASREKPTKY